jgi:hypothetical protein
MSAGVSEFGGEAALLAAERLRRPDARRLEEEGRGDSSKKIRGSAAAHQRHRVTVASCRSRSSTGGLHTEEEACP